MKALTRYYSEIKPSTSVDYLKYKDCIVTALLLGAFTISFLRTAWVAEDAFITFRVIDNLLSGYGPNWNIAERVQVYTHPLWLMLLTPLTWITGSAYWSSLLLSFSLSIATITFILKQCNNNCQKLLITALIIGSKSFIDFSSSGLEMPLVYLLSSCLILSFIKNKSTLLVCFICSALFLTRPDSILLALPILAHRILPNINKHTVTGIFIGFTPVIAWIIFSLFYYGSPLPNTALAKAGTGYGLLEKTSNSLNLYHWVISNDPITLIIPLLAIIAGLTNTNPKVKTILSSIIVWFIYVAYVGGDYMAGRFLTPPLIASLFILIFTQWQPKSIVTTSAIVALCASFYSNTLLSPPSYANFNISSGGIADERGFYYQHTGLIPNLNGPKYSDHPWSLIGTNTVEKKGEIVVSCFIGMTGYHAPANTHIIDPLALADPFVARLPSRPGARIGHYERGIPPEYLKTRISGENKFSNEKLATLWNLVESVTQDDLLSRKRLWNIFLLNSHYKNLAASSNYDRSATYYGEQLVSTNSKLSCLGQHADHHFYQARLDKQQDLILSNFPWQK